MTTQLILLVDDDPDILKVLKANLSLYGFNALTAESWKAASSILEASLPDLVVLDVMLPDGDGMEICRRIKDDYPRLPVIMLTARDAVYDKVTGLESGADDYIVKPFETPELIARIRVCLRRSVFSESALTVGDLDIDSRARSLKVMGREVELTKKEFDLLHLLATSRGEVISREIIRKKIWGDAKLYSWSRAIDVHIQHLRQKIEKDPSNPEYILTVSGIGYKFRK